MNIKDYAQSTRTNRCATFYNSIEEKKLLVLAEIYDVPVAAVLRAGLAQLWELNKMKPRVKTSKISKKCKRRSIHLNDEEYEKVKVLSDKLNINYSVVLREGLKALPDPEVLMLKENTDGSQEQRSMSSDR